MNVDLSKELADHFERISDLAQEAAEDESESFSSRSSAMTALTRMLHELTEVQGRIYNIERLMVIEKTTIEVLRKHLSQEQMAEFIKELDERLTQ